MSGLYHGYILEFPLIRVDCFTPLPARGQPWLLPRPDNPCLRRPAPQARLFLLTHVHSDHLVGLSNDFTGRIVCSPETKQMLLRLEAEKDRLDYDRGLRETKKRKYSGLGARSLLVNGRSVDLIETLNTGESRNFDLGVHDGKDFHVTITLLDANHCPGSSMFLIRSATTAVLHTGDIRADPTFLSNLRRHPAVHPYIHCPAYDASRNHSIRRTLQRIYLDTSALFGVDLPHKETVIEQLLGQMGLYPPDTVFFLNIWCFGWEDVIKEVARYFDSKVHVDRYKRSVYAAISSDPFLLDCTTQDAESTRFHACERFLRCAMCRGGKATDGLRCVQVSMVDVPSAAWEIRQTQFIDNLGLAALGERPWPLTIEVPWARHSTLPELQSLVQLFRPQALSPNTVIDGKQLFLFPHMFEGSVGRGDGFQTMLVERDEWFASTGRFHDEWVALKALPISLFMPMSQPVEQDVSYQRHLSRPVSERHSPNSEPEPDTTMLGARIEDMATPEGRVPFERCASEPCPSEAVAERSQRDISSDDHGRSTPSSPPASTKGDEQPAEPNKTRKRRREVSKFRVNIDHFVKLTAPSTSTS